MPNTPTTRKTILCTLITILSIITPRIRAAATDATAPATAPAPPPTWFSLEAKPKPLPAGNPTDPQGIVRKFDFPALAVTHHSTPEESKGTVLLFPGGAYSILDTLNEGSRTAEKLNAFGYDVAMLEYHVGGGKKSRDAALEDAQTTWQILKTKPESLSLAPHRLILMGYSAGGHLAARMLQTMPEDQQPDDLMLVYPAYLEETAPNSTTPLVQPPARLKSRLVAMMAANDRANWLKGARDYVAVWQAAGGYGVMLDFKTGGHGFGMKPNLTGDLAQWPDILNYFLTNGPKPGVGPFNSVLPWFLPNVAGRLAAFTRDKTADQNAVVFLGDSITAKWNLPEAFKNLHVANRGISGDTTRGMLNRLQDNVLDLHPKAIIFMGGINDLFGQPKATPETISANLRSILEQVRTANQNTPVLVCQILPCKTMPNQLVTASNAAIEKVLPDFPNAHLIKTYAPFLNPDGTQNTSLFLDGTHPNPAGYTIWKEALDPELAKYLK